MNFKWEILLVPYFIWWLGTNALTITELLTNILSFTITYYVIQTARRSKLEERNAK